MNMNDNNNVSFNGRINIAQPNTKTLFDMYDKIPQDSKSTEFREALVGNWQDTTLSKAFFSGQNIQIIQNAIRAGVFKSSNGQYIIAPQDEDNLKIIMRSTYLQYAANMENDVTHQVNALNKIVLDYAVKQVYGEAQSYIKYIHDASNMYTPMDRPVQPNNPTKTLDVTRHIGFM
jgi:citrate lyase gamma subunit